MDSRNQERYPAGLQVRVTAVDDSSLSASGDVSDVSSSGISVYLPLKLTIGAAVRLSVHDSVLFGFVVHSEPDRSYFRTGISVLQVLFGGSDLSQLLRATLEEAMPEVQLLETLP